MDETEYLLSSENNKEHLERSIEQANKLLNSPLKENETVLSLMQSMSLKELKMLKISCDILIGFKESGTKSEDVFKGNK